MSSCPDHGSNSAVKISLVKKMFQKYRFGSFVGQHTRTIHRAGAQDNSSNDMGGWGKRCHHDHTKELREVNVRCASLCSYRIRSFPTFFYRTRTIEELTRVVVFIS